MQVGLKKKALERAATAPHDYLPDLDEGKFSPQNGGDSEEEDTWSQDEERRVIVLIRGKVEDWQPSNDFLDPSRRPGAVIPPSDMQIDAPMRIACYRRHHGEKMGFNNITIEDFQGRVVAQAMSNPIMITDDNKVHLIVQVSHPQVSETVTSTTTPLRLPQAMNGNDGVPSISQSHGTSTEIPERLVYMVSRLQANGPVLCFIRR
ncbi:SPT3 Dosage dependent suppressor of Ty-induced promoter mutations-like protein [Metarhizium acridum]|uniref:SPT3 Dosage dependent suppressor of Ty-induced promoter mutations-like protein n=1 Tax=Metarhizium acridum TaxID=92637 RepID=UPI001C6C83C2|nr:SPT3 Dosage dependent suppressor of Ty-induced promoter mutations-like protein [Metarhizium acridum]